MVPNVTRTGLRALLAGSVVVSIAACTSEHVTSVAVTSVTVAPATVSAVEGELHELSAVVIDDGGEVLARPHVEWSSEDDAIARVDAEGVVKARAPGVVRVRATFREASGSATVRVLPAYAIGVSRDSVAMTAGSTGIDPPPEVVHVTNTGVGDLEGLTVDVRYPEGADGDWLTATLGATRTPTTLTLDADSEPLALGVHRATVVLEADGVDPVEIAVTLDVRIL